MKPAGERSLLSGRWALRASPPGVQAAELDAAAGAWLPVEQPMPAAAALRAAGRLDPLSTSLDAHDWWYRCEFGLPGREPDETMVLGFDGLATLARVWLNGEPLLDSDNMFVAHECDVTGRLRPGVNELLIRFGALDSALAQRRPRPRWRVPMLGNQQLRWFRTTLLGRTPGWSPPWAAVGPWKDVWLERRGSPRVANVRVDAHLEGTTGVVDCHVDLSPGPSAAQGMELRLERDGREHVQRLAATQAGSFEGQLRLADAQLWWPHTHGEPALYAARLCAVDASGQPVKVASGKLGFRSVALDTAGGGFRIEVNGAPVFCRGAVWTPLDGVSLRSAPGDCRAAVLQVRGAGMNMLRVAGTMVYEEDHFYEACDELGVLVWQDFMFANMDYPADDEAFSASVALEATQQLQRLHAHPCVAVLCGNSEAEQQGAMWGAPREQWCSPLFGQTLAQLCAIHAPRTPYWPSSAHGGAVPFQADVGTTSYYGVGAYLRPLEDARRSGLRFATECLAFANVPSAAAIARMPGGLATRVHHPQWKARTPRDLGAGWDFEDVRDHYLRLLFDADPQALRYADHDRYLELSRLATAEVMAAAFSEWRRPASPCGGALVLFLRDLWAGAGWGVLDDRGAPKACWHAVARVLQPQAVLLTDEGGNGLFVHVLNETAREAHWVLELAAWQHGAVPVANASLPLTVPGRGARTVPALEMLDHFMDLTYAYRFGAPACDAVAVTLRGERGEPVAQAFHFPAGMAALFGIDAGLAASARMVDAQAAEVTVSARKFALGVHFDVPGFEPQDEYFHLAPGGQARVLLRSRGGGEPHGSVHAVNAHAAATIRVDAPTSR